jgi:hypothetical protein
MPELLARPSCVTYVPTQLPHPMANECKFRLFRFATESQTPSHASQAAAATCALRSTDGVGSEPMTYPGGLQQKGQRMTTDTHAKCIAHATSKSPHHASRQAVQKCICASIYLPVGSIVASPGRGGHHTVTLHSSFTADHKCMDRHNNAGLGWAVRSFGQHAPSCTLMHTVATPTCNSHNAATMR